VDETDGQNEEEDEAGHGNGQQVSISPTFYAQLLRSEIPKSPKNTDKLFKYVHIKAARKMYVKLTTGVNFTNILFEPFLYKGALCSFSLLTIWLSNFLAKEYWPKSFS